MKDLLTIVIVAFSVILAFTRSEEVRYSTENDEKPCTYFYADRVAQPESGLVNCSWYYNSACCKRTEVTSVFANAEPLHSATRSCRNQLNYLMCYFCSPDQHLWFIEQKLHVCAKYCKSLYEECLTAGVGERLFGTEYANGSVFCEAQDFVVTEGANCFEYDPDVFGKASVTTVNFLLFSVLILLFMCIVN